MSEWSMQGRETLAAGILLAAQVKPKVEKRVQENKVGSERNNVSHSAQSPCVEGIPKIGRKLSPSLSELDSTIWIAQTNDWKGALNSQMQLGNWRHDRELMRNCVCTIVLKKEGWNHKEEMERHTSVDVAAG